MMWRLIKAAILIAGARSLWSNKFVRRAVKRRLSDRTKRLLPI